MKTRSKLLGLALAIIIILSMLIIGFFQDSHSGTTNKKQQRLQKTSVENQSNALPKHTKLSDWQLLLVNKQQPRTSEISFNKVTVDDKQIDQRIARPLANFRASAKNAGYDTTLVSAYRSIAYQAEVYNTSLKQNEANGMNKESAKKLTESVIQTPGSSEHQTGLAVDLAGNDALAKYPNLVAQMDTFASQQWLIKHASDYGFVLRYLADSKSIAQTGIDYESWHFRYVGVINAKYMVQHHLTLEAYRDELKKAAQK